MKTQWLGVVVVNCQNKKSCVVKGCRNWWTPDKGQRQWELENSNGGSFTGVDIFLQLAASASLLTICAKGF